MSGAPYSCPTGDLITFDDIETFDGSFGTATAHGPTSSSYSTAANGGVSVGAGNTSGKAEAQWDAYRAEAEGPHVRGKAFARHVPNTPIAEVGAMAEIGAGRAEANAGILSATVGLNANTGARVGTTGAEVNLLGFGLAFGKKTSINTPLGSLGFKRLRKRKAKKDSSPPSDYGV